MRLRSTGLGKTELEAEIVDAKRIDDIVVIYINTTKPVKWRTRMGLQETDLRNLVRFVFRRNNLSYIIRALLPGKKKVSRTESF